MLSVPALANEPEFRLIEAVKQNDQDAVRALLETRIDVNLPQPDGATALHWAVYLDNIETSVLLIDAGAVVGATNELGVTPLYLACENGNTVLVRKLLSAGAAPDATLPSGETVLMTAALTGSVGAVSALLTHGAEVQTTEHMEGQTALMWAASQKHPGVVKALIEAGADVQARSHVRPVVTSRSGSVRLANSSAASVIDEGGFTPLLFAARSGDIVSARLLLAAGADANDTAPSGTSALVVAAHSGHGALAALLLDAGADANAADAGYGPLHAAVLRSDTDLVRSLLAHGANPNVGLTQGTEHARQGKLYALDAQWVGATPFFLAAKYGLDDIMRLLANAGADPLAGIEGGTTPLMVAAGMLTRGFGRTGTDRWGREMDSAEMELAVRQDPDHRSVMGSGINAVKVAVDLGADVNATSRSGDTALHLAAFHGFKTVVRYLVSKGARLDVKNEGGETPLGFAMRARAPARMSNSLVDYTDMSTADLLRELGAVE